MKFKDYISKRWILWLILLISALFVAIQTKCIILGILIFGFYVLISYDYYLILKSNESINRLYEFMSELNDTNLESSANLKVITDITDSCNKNLYLLHQFLISKGFNWKEYEEFVDKNSNSYKSILPKIS